MELAILISLLLSIFLYISIGFWLKRDAQSLGNYIPISVGKSFARVKKSNEFSASTIATTISLATVIIAYYDLIPYYGTWLLWTALTTSIGFLVMILLSERIWKKLKLYTDHKPTLHEFLGNEFQSSSVSIIGAICTTIGFLLIYAVELSIGSRFLASLIPEISPWISIFILSGVGIVYTFLGGFRAVILTDKIQMYLIWLLIIVLGLFFGALYFSHDHLGYSMNAIPNNLFDFSYKDGLIAFLIGIFIMNVPTHLSNMSIWQRIAGVDDYKMVKTGFFKSMTGSFISWSALVILALLTLSLCSPTENQNLLATFILKLGSNTIGRIVIFFVILGLYGAMLSTASTQLIVVAHTVYEDIFAKMRKTKISVRLLDQKEGLYPRGILLLSAVIAFIVVQILIRSGFSIIDLIFAIYGGQLVLFPLIIFSLFFSNDLLSNLKGYAIIAVSAGFFVGWGSAIYGFISENGSMVFLAPTFSIAFSFLVLFIGLFQRKKFLRIGNER